MTAREVVFAGAGGLARETLAASREFRTAGFVDDDRALVGTTISGLRVLGTIDRLALVDHRITLCVGSGHGRESIARRLADLGVPDRRYATIVHPNVSIPSTCRSGPGSILLAGVVLTTDVHVGKHVVVMPNSVLTHDNFIDDFATICAGVTLGGNVTVGRAAYLGMNSSVRENLTIGAGAVLGMGSVLLEDLPAGQTWAGSPARPIRSSRLVHGGGAR